MTPLILVNLRTLSRLDPFAVYTIHGVRMSGEGHANRFLRNLEEIIVPPSKKPKRNTSNFPQTEFVNLKLNKKQAAEFEDWKNGDAGKISTRVVEFIADGNKTSISYDFDNECFIVSSTCKAEGHANENRCMTSRSEDWYEALLMNVFKNDVVLHGGEWIGEDEGRKWG